METPLCRPIFNVWPRKPPKQRRGRDCHKKTATWRAIERASAQAVPLVLRSDCQQISAHPSERKRLVDVGPLVIPNPQAAKLTEPCKGALYDPPPPAQATPMFGAALGQ
jgi:hypothetical protein